jgi:hypothetical protein
MRFRVIALVVALGAGTALLLAGPDRDPAPTSARATLATAWPRAQRADFPANLPDGPIFQPGLFLDARTAIGTAPSPDGRSLRLMLRGAEGEVREMRRRPLSQNPSFDHFAMAGDEVAWTESADGRPVEIWTADPRTRDARKLTADTGDAVFYGSQYDLVIADGRVHWVAGAGAEATEFRSVPLAGGEVRVRTEPGVWSLTTWPWVTSGAADPTGTTVLRDPTANQERRVPVSGAELASCTPAWCRVMVMAADGLARIDVMRPDGRDRRRIAGAGAGAAVGDVAILDRFEVLSEARPDSDLTGAEGLLIHDIATGRTVDLSGSVSGAFSRGGVVWWSTGDQDSLVWHTVDLRTV